ncbi:MAG TPA: hypothetical protein VHR84_03740 [Terriglobales bacterium]|nr:hypothetical protein [Terriglobales bacterium]
MSRFNRIGDVVAGNEAKLMDFKELRVWNTAHDLTLGAGGEWRVWASRVVAIIQFVLVSNPSQP